ncbi:MAG TPA: choloylglycine hydrolase family protein [Pseudosphingobacterium sp.]|nr:choloylglycine hydrolase family protein [Pseudosphingobacterium sp.]
MCTGIQLKTTSGAPIYGRTMEFSIDLKSQALVIPKGTKFVGVGPTSTTIGMAWTSHYEITGLNTMGLDVVIDGINSAGLSVGAFYFVGYAGYMNVPSEDANQSICSTDVCTYLLSKCATVEDVKKVLPGLKVNSGIAPVAAKGLNTTNPVALHYNIHDAAGNVLAVEYINGKLNIHDNPIGVLTNSPDYNWHYTNLSNYVNLTPINKNELRLKDMTDTGNKLVSILPTGQGTGFLGLPGDYTPPSRFIRAVAYSQSVQPVQTNEEAVLQAFHILNAFDIPFGTVREIKDLKESLEYTLWTVVSDLQNRRFYFHTEGDPAIRMIDLANWKFKGTQVVKLSINQGPTIINMADYPEVEQLA